MALPHVYMEEIKGFRFNNSPYAVRRARRVKESPNGQNLLDWIIWS
jgi:hypothetical protein